MYVLAVYALTLIQTEAKRAAHKTLAFDRASNPKIILMY